MAFFASNILASEGKVSEGTASGVPSVEFIRSWIFCKTGSGFRMEVRDVRTERMAFGRESLILLNHRWKTALSVPWGLDG